MTLGIFAVLMGLIAAFGFQAYWAKPEAPLPPPAKAPPAPPPEVAVPLASEDLPADRVVARGDLVEVRLTKQQAGERFKGLDPFQILRNPKLIVGRRLKKPIKQGQPFLSTSLYLQGTGPNVANMLKPGYRAVRLQVPDTREGGIQPGSYVDIVFRAKPRRAQGDEPAIPETTKTLLQHVLVLGMERQGAKESIKAAPLAPPKKPLLVTLAVPEDKMDIFSVIEGRGEVWLVPTPTEGGKEAAQGEGAPLPKPLTLAALLGIKKPPPPEWHKIPPKPTPPPPFETAIYRRGHVQINQFVNGKLVASRAHERASTAPGKRTSATRAGSPADPADIDTEE
jgi:Flp pilus assembly protein CpaB